MTPAALHQPTHLHLEMTQDFIKQTSNTTHARGAINTTLAYLTFEGTCDKSTRLSSTRRIRFVDNLNCQVSMTIRNLNSILMLSIQTGAINRTKISLSIKDVIHLCLRIKLDKLKPKTRLASSYLKFKKPGDIIIKI